MDSGGGTVDLAGYNKYIAEGDVMTGMGPIKYEIALDLFNKALLCVSPNDVLEVSFAKLGLYHRSRCYLALGNHVAALKDAEMILKEDPTFVHGISAKAEALYFCGDFESALVFFHRGHKLRPEFQQFRMGINKCREAITNAIGSTDACQLKVPDSPKPSSTTRGGSSEVSSKPAQNRKRTNKQNSASTTHVVTGGDKTVKTLLGELYADAVYLENLLKDPSLTYGATGTKVKGIASDGLEYLGKRVNFWRQQNPIYARQHESHIKMLGVRKIPKKTLQQTARKVKMDTREITKALTEMTLCFEKDEFQKVVKQGQGVLKILELGDEEAKLAGEICTLVGNAHLELDEIDDALKFHTRDLELSEHHGARQRALIHLGRVHASKKDFPKAVEVWTEAIPLTLASVESSWLHHEIGRCHVELHNFAEAIIFGKKALSCALDAADNVWLMHANLLIGQASVRNGDLHAGHKGYTEALSLAQGLGEYRLEKKINQAIAFVVDKIAGDLPAANEA